MTARTIGLLHTAPAHVATFRGSLTLKRGRFAPTIRDMSTRPTVMDRLAGTEITVSPDRYLADAIRAWETDPQDLGLLDYTGLHPAELAALVVGERSVRELLDARGRRTAAA